MNLFEFIQLCLARSVYIFFPMLGCIAFVFLLERLSVQMGLIDTPDSRKQHIGAIPLVGGPAMFMAIALSAMVLLFKMSVVLFLGLGLLLLILGIADDKLNIKASHRLLIQAAITLVMIYGGHVKIDQIGNLFGTGPVSLSGYTAILFTIMCTIGVINSVNMIDGLDGLAGSILLASFAGLGWLAWEAGEAHHAKLIAIIGGALLGFLCFNSRVILNKAMVFMGDSGSMLMGFTMAWLLISLTQTDVLPVSAVTAGWIFGLPLADTMTVMVGRLVHGKSPFEAGRDHLHHRLLDAGFSVNKAVALMFCIHSLFVLVGVLANGHRVFEPMLFWGFVVIVVVHYFVTPRLLPARPMVSNFAN